MKIAIFGCSYSDEKSSNALKNPNGRGWATILREDYNLDITNFGMSGSGMYYSYQRFKQANVNFDKIIFQAADANRLYCPNFRIPHLLISDSFKDSGRLDETERNHVKFFYSFLNNEDENEDMKELMKRDIMESRKETLYIDVKELTLINNLDFQNAKMKKNVTIAQPDFRYNHMNNSNNIIFAKKIYDWFQTNQINLSATEFQCISEEEVNSYKFPI